MPDTSAYHRLSDRQRNFVDAYLASGNATQSYHQAGYKGNANLAGVEGLRTLRKPKIQAALAERRAQLASTYDVTPERVIAELALIAFSDLYDYVTWGPDGVTLRDAGQVDARARRVVQEVSQTTTLAGGTVRFKLHNKLDALDKLARHLDLYNATAAEESDGKGLWGLMELLKRHRTPSPNGQHQPE
jgi:phage terminase small subunit